MQILISRINRTVDAYFVRHRQRELDRIERWLAKSPDLIELERRQRTLQNRHHYY